MRATTHYGVTENDIEVAVSAIADALRDTTYRPRERHGRPYRHRERTVRDRARQKRQRAVITEPQQDRPRVAVALIPSPRNPEIHP